MAQASVPSLPTLPDSVCSPQDLQSLIVEIRQYAKWFAHGAVKQRLNIAASGDSAEPPAITPAANQMIMELGGPDNLSTQALDNLIADLDELKATARTMSITLAAPAGNVLKRELVAWCRQNIEPGVLVSFAFNSTILGGMVVRYGSRIHDWSFRREILAKRQDFPKHLREADYHG